jgi:3',5'-cyclic AMP phosphodiesterase CpdA
VEHATPGGNRALAALLERPELRQADVVLITGDVTDRGTAGSWQRFREIITRADLADRVVLVPGNHDLSLIDPFGHWRDPAAHWRRNDRFGIVQLANLLKFCESFAWTGGGRQGSVLRDGRPVAYAEAWRECEREVRLLALFPVAVTIPGRDGVVFVLNSCTPVARHPATNALGRVGRNQYRRLDRLAAFFPQSIKLLALHHHVVRRLEERSHDLVDRIVAKFTVLGDAPPLVRFCRRHGIRAVLNGHRHLSYQLRLPSGTVLIAAPSSTIGDELAHDPRPQFDRYDVARTSDGFTVGVHRQVVRLAGRPGQT